MENKSNIEELIANIKKRPKMYVYEIRIDYIYYLLAGYLAGIIDMSFTESIEYVFKRDFGGYVVQWVRKNLCKNYSDGVFIWYQIISSCKSDDKEAVDLFFKISEEFFKEYHLNHK